MVAGFDLSQLAWSPTTDDEREQVRRAGPDFTFWPPLEEEEAETLLRRLFALRRRWLRSESAGEREELEREAQELTAKLVEGLTGWAATRHMVLSHVAAVFLRDSTHPLLSRQTAIGSLRMPLPLMPVNTRTQLAEALDGLWDGRVAPILRPRGGGPRGIEWRHRQEIQLHLLGWAEWQVARGSLGREKAFAYVGRACGLDSGAQAVRAWQRRLTERLGKRTVAKVLVLPRRVGRMEAAVGDPARNPELAACAAELRFLDVHALGREYRRVSQSRTTTRPGPPARKVAAKPRKQQAK